MPDMQLAVVLPSWVYDQERARLAHLAFETLLNTRTKEFVKKPWLGIMLRESKVPFEYPPIALMDQVFHTNLELGQGEQLSGTEQTLAYGTQWMFDAGADYVTWMGDDALFHPEWLHQLQALVSRHPEAKCWSVYRSAHTAFHKTIIESGDDVMVASICGHGFTISKQEWTEWGIRWQDGSWGCHQGDTLDLCHAQYRPGERWCTAKSYVEHTGRYGQHCRPHIPEWAQNFQGVEG